MKNAITGIEAIVETVECLRLSLAGVTVTLREVSDRLDALEAEHSSLEEEEQPGG